MIVGPPVGTASLTTDLRALGVRPGAAMIVHSALSSLGWVIGDAPAVIAALAAALGADGTLAMPTHSGGLSDPAGWVAPPVPVEWHDRIRAEMPAYDPAITPTRIMGAIPESFRSHPGVRRSAHPRQSFAARGPQAAFITADHALDCAMGERPPLARLPTRRRRAAAGRRSRAQHLAALRRVPRALVLKHNTTFASPVMIDGQRRWLEVDDLDFDDSDFARLGDDFEHDTEAVLIGKVGAAPARSDAPARGRLRRGWIGRASGADAAARRGDGFADHVLVADMVGQQQHQRGVEPSLCCGVRPLCVDDQVVDVVGPRQVQLVFQRAHDVARFSAERITESSSARQRPATYWSGRMR